MSAVANKELARDLVKDWNAIKGDAAKLRTMCDKYLAPGYIRHTPSGDSDREKQIQMFISVTSAFPDYTMTIDDLVAESDKVVNRFTLQGTQKEAFMGIPASGKKFSINAVIISKIAGGKVIEEWEQGDTLGLMTQLGAIPAAPKK